jgi:hypothetical protein
LQWSCSKVHSTLMGTNNRARIKITAERIALYYDRGLAFWNTFILRINTSLLRISQFTELKYSTNQWISNKISYLATSRSALRRNVYLTCDTSYANYIHIQVRGGGPDTLDPPPGSATATGRFKETKGQRRELRRKAKETGKSRVGGNQEFPDIAMEDLKKLTSRRPNFHWSKKGSRSVGERGKRSGSRVL